MDISEIKEELEKFEINKQANLRKSRTRLPCNISFQTEAEDGKKYTHNTPRTKFQNNTADKTNPNELIPISIETGQVLVGKPYNKKYIEMFYPG